MALRTCDLVVHSFTILSYHDLSSIGGLTLKDARTKEFKEGKKLQFMNRHLSFHNLRCDLKSIFKSHSHKNKGKDKIRKNLVNDL